MIITGTNLFGATAVDFGASGTTSFTVNSATSITAVSPAGSAGTVDITVTTPIGTSTTSVGRPVHLCGHCAQRTDRQLHQPHIGIKRGGTTVTITGTNFSGATDG